MNQKFTMTTAALVTTAAIILLGIVDLVLVVFYQGSVNGSISSFLRNLGISAPFPVFVFGFAAGHVFGYMSLDKGENHANS